MSSSHSIEILEQARREKLYTKVVVQLQKDFDRANVPLSIELTISISDLYAVVHEKIYVLLLEKFDQYLNLLYIIDVPEKEFKGINSSHVVTIASQVSFLIFRRVFKKVKLKAEFEN